MVDEMKIQEMFSFGLPKKIVKISLLKLIKIPSSLKENKKTVSNLNGN
jgi:hypothetical protein